MKFYNFPLCLFSAVWSYPCYCPAYWVLQARELWSGESGDSHWVYNQTDNVTVIVVYWDVFFFLHILVFMLIYYYWWWLKNDDILISSLLRNGCWPLWRIHSVIRATSVSHDCFLFCFISAHPAGKDAVGWRQLCTDLVSWDCMHGKKRRNRLKKIKTKRKTGHLFTLWPWNPMQCLLFLFPKTLYIA